MTPSTQIQWDDSFNPNSLVFPFQTTVFLEKYQKFSINFNYCMLIKWLMAEKTCEVNV